MWYMVGLENMTKKVCDQAIKLAPDVQNLSQVSSTCAIGKNAGFTGDGIDLVCNQAGALVIDSEDISSLFEICTNPFFTTGFDENEIHSICSRYFTVAIESGSPNVLRNLCFDARAIGQSEEDARTACIKAVDLSVEQDEPNTAKELCIFAEGVDQDVVQQACEGYRDIATRIVDSTDDAYVLRDMCSNGSIAGFPEDLIKNACDRGIELVVDSDDPYLLTDMCYSGHVTESEDGLEAVCNLAVESAIINEEVELVGNLCWNIQQEYILIKDSQQACDGFRDLSRKIIDSSNDVYVLSGICFTGLDTGIQGEAIQKACERGVQLAFGTDDSWLIKDYCYNGFEAGLGNDEIDTACNLAAELAIRDEDFELGTSLCWSTGPGRLSESNFQRVCEVGTIQILPGEQISSIVDPGIFELWSFQGLAGQEVDITLIAGSNGQFSTWPCWIQLET